MATTIPGCTAVVVKDTFRAGDQDSTATRTVTLAPIGSAARCAGLTSTLIGKEETVYLLIKVEVTSVSLNVSRKKDTDCSCTPMNSETPAASVLVQFRRSKRVVMPCGKSTGVLTVLAELEVELKHNCRPWLFNTKAFDWSYLRNDSVVLTCTRSCTNPSLNSVESNTMMTRCEPSSLMSVKSRTVCNKCQRAEALLPALVSFLAVAKIEKVQVVGVATALCWIVTEKSDFRLEMPSVGCMICTSRRLRIATVRSFLCSTCAY